MYKGDRQQKKENSSKTAFASRLLAWQLKVRLPLSILLGPSHMRECSTPQRLSYISTDVDYPNGSFLLCIHSGKGSSSPTIGLHFLNIYNNSLSLPQWRIFICLIISYNAVNCTIIFIFRKKLLNSEIIVALLLTAFVSHLHSIKII